MKNKIIRNIIYGLTLSVPTIVYLFVVAIYGGVDFDYVIKTNQDTYEMVHHNKGIFLYDPDNNTTFVEGQVEFNNAIGYYGVMLLEDDIVLVDGTLRRVIRNDNGRLEARQMRYQDIKKQETYRFSTAFFVSIIGVGIVALVVSGKMQWRKKYPVLSTLVALITGTAILAVIHFTIGHLFYVFLIFTISFAIFTIEYYAFGSMDKEKKEKEGIDKKQQELDNMLELLKGAINEK